MDINSALSEIYHDNRTLDDVDPDGVIIEKIIGYINSMDISPRCNGISVYESEYGAYIDDAMILDTNPNNMIEITQQFTKVKNYNWNSINAEYCDI